MKIRKLLAFALATTMVFGASMTAFATEADPGKSLMNGEANSKGGYSTQITGSATVETPVIKIIVPTSAAVILNPYKISVTPASANTKVTTGAGESATETTLAVSTGAATTDQVASATYSIWNLSNVDIVVNPTITAKATGVTLLEAAPATGDKNEAAKWGVIKFNVTKIGDAAQADTVTTDDVILGKTYKDSTPTFTLPKATSTKTTNSDGTVTYTYSGQKSVEFKFVGQLNTPDKVATAWNETDSIALTVKYDFLPQAAN